MDFVKKRLIYFYFILSALVLLPGVVSLVAPGGLRMGIEFTSGSTLTLEFQQEVTQEKLRQELLALGYKETVIQRLEGGAFFIRLPEITRVEKEQIEASLTQDLGELRVLDFAAVSPVVSKEIVRDAVIAVIAAIVGILLYIAWAFRHMPRPFRWSCCLIVALAHDVVVMIGVFSILGRVFNLQIDALFIAAALAVVGFSDNNIVVVFDRFRENLTLEGSHNLAQTFNRSISQTLSRCLITSLTAIFVLLALLLLGGPTTRNFILALTIGLVAGTYSSLFIAPMLLFLWERGRRV